MPMPVSDDHRCRNFPVKKKERQNAASDRNYKEFQKIQKILDKIRSIANGKDIIKSGDENAVEKLGKKLAGLKENQERMKAANKALRMKDTEKGDAALRELGYTYAQIAELRKPDSATRDLLKKNGFRWSPRNECCRGQLTNNARYAMKQVLKSLEGEN